MAATSHQPPATSQLVAGRSIDLFTRPAVLVLSRSTGEQKSEEVWSKEEQCGAQGSSVEHRGAAGEHRGAAGSTKEQWGAVWSREEQRGAKRSSGVKELL